MRKIFSIVIVLISLACVTFRLPRELHLFSVYCKGDNVLYGLGNFVEFVSQIMLLILTASFFFLSFRREIKHLFSKIRKALNKDEQKHRAAEKEREKTERKRAKLQKKLEEMEKAE